MMVPESSERAATVFLDRASATVFCGPSLYLMSKSNSNICCCSLLRVLVCTADSDSRGLWSEKRVKRRPRR